MKLVVQELLIQAPAAEVYELLVDPELFIGWMAEDATLDPVPGGFAFCPHHAGPSPGR